MDYSLKTILGLTPDGMGRPCVSTDLARLEYFQRQNPSESFCDVLECYRRDLPAPAEDPTPSTSTTAIVRQRLARDALEDSRKEQGLDTLRLKLLTTLIEAATFERGLEFLCRRPGRRTRLLRSGQETGMASRDAPPGDESTSVSDRYSDLCADEVSLCGLLGDSSKPALLDEVAPFTHPVGIVGMDADGLLFSRCSRSGERLERMDTNEAHAVGGITGGDFVTEHHGFVEEVKAIIKTLLVLRVDSAGLFESLFDEEDLTSLLRGDGMLLMEWLARRTQQRPGEPGGTLENLLSVHGPASQQSRLKAALRGEIAEFLAACTIRNRRGERHGVAEIVRIFGMATRLPAFVIQNRPFHGYVTLYGCNLEFLTAAGDTDDSVPLVDYLNARFHDKLVDLMRTSDERDEGVMELFTELRDGVSDRNLKEGKKTPLDELQEKVLTRYGILVPVQVSSRLRKDSSLAEFYISRRTRSTFIERSMKFGPHEITLLHDTLASLPRLFSRGIRMVSKKLLEKFNFDAFACGSRVAGSYHQATGRVEIGVPPPVEEDAWTPAAQLGAWPDALAEAQRNRHGLLAREVEAELREGFLLHVFLHEVAESIVASLPAGFLEAWSRLGPPASKVDGVERRRHFVSIYATTSPKEDFCEFFAAYVLFGAELRKASRSAPVLRSKYRFMRDLFRCDGVKREFSARFTHSMGVLFGDAALPWQELDRRRFFQDLRGLQRRLEDSERRANDVEAMSYEDLKTVMLELEEDGEPCTAERAGEILGRRVSEDMDALEEHASERRFRMAESRSLELMVQAGMSPLDAEVKLEDVFRCAMDRPRKEALALLRNLGVLRRRREDLLTRLVGLFECFETRFRDRFWKETADPFTSEKENMAILMALVADVEQRWTALRSAQQDGGAKMEEEGLSSR